MGLKPFWSHPTAQELTRAPHFLLAQSSYPAQPCCPDPWSFGSFRPAFTWNSTMHFLKDKSSVLNGFC